MQSSQAGFAERFAGEGSEEPSRGTQKGRYTAGQMPCLLDHTYLVYLCVISCVYVSCKNTMCMYSNAIVYNYNVLDKDVIYDKMNI